MVPVASGSFYKVRMGLNMGVSENKVLANSSIRAMSTPKQKAP